MKTLLQICILLLLLKCTKQSNFPVDNVKADTISATTKDNEQDSDTIDFKYVVLNDSVKLKYHKVAYYGFESWFKNMAIRKILAPDVAWNKFISLKEYNSIRSDFTSEIGQDAFYQLYAYFLQQINQEIYHKERLALFSAYSDFNFLKSYFQYGGTYFGHMRKRIYAYTEYSLYMLDKELNAQTNIGNDKTAFINGLKKLYSDELIDDNDTMENDKPKRLAIMMHIIDHIDTQISTVYLLKETKQFYKDHYDCWL